METYYVAFHRLNVRIEVAVRAKSRTEARMISERELKRAIEYAYMGTNQ